MDGVQVEVIDVVLMDIFENVGVQFCDEIVLVDWKCIGVKVEGELVYLDCGFVCELVVLILLEFIYYVCDL